MSKMEININDPYFLEQINKRNNLRIDISILEKKLNQANKRKSTVDVYPVSIKPYKE